MNAKVKARVQARMQRAEQYSMSDAQRSDMYHTVLAQELDRQERMDATAQQRMLCLPEQWAAELSEYNVEYSNATALYRGTRLG